MSSLGTALYYPNFHMDSNWAKAALLYWDSLARIVPTELQATIDEDDEFSRQLADAKILIDIDTSAYVDEAAERFNQFLVPLFRKDPAIVFDAKYVAKIIKQVSRIHPAKMTYELQNNLRRMGVHEDDKKFLRIPGKVAGPYMLCLSTVMTEKLGIPLITDEPIFERLGEYLCFGAPRADMEDPNKKALFRLGLPMPSGQNLYNVELDEILKFRERRLPERLRLKAELDVIMKEAADISDENRLNLFWESKRREVEAVLKDYKRCLKAINLIDFASLFKISVPTGVATAITSASGAIEPNTAVALTALAFAVDAGGVLGHRMFRRQAADQKNPWLYAMQIRYTYDT